MSRLLASLLPLALLAGVVGCHHTAGVCDCDHGKSFCCYAPYPVCAPSPVIIGTTPVPAKAAEPIKEMPKAK